MSAAVVSKICRITPFCGAAAGCQSIPDHRPMDRGSEGFMLIGSDHRAPRATPASWLGEGRSCSARRPSGAAEAAASERESSASFASLRELLRRARRQVVSDLHRVSLASYWRSPKSELCLRLALPPLRGTLSARTACSNSSSNPKMATGIERCRGDWYTIVLNWAAAWLPVEAQRWIGYPSCQSCGKHFTAGVARSGRSAAGWPSISMTAATACLSPPTGSGRSRSHRTGSRRT